MTTNQIIFASIALFSTGSLAYGLYSGTFLGRDFRPVRRWESPNKYKLYVVGTLIALGISVAGALGFGVYLSVGRSHSYFGY